MARTAADLQAQADAVGATLLSVSYDREGRLVGEFCVPDIEDGKPFATAQLLENLAASDIAMSAIPPGVAAKVRGLGPAGLLAWVQSAVRFEHEDTETFQSPLASFQNGFGDCDDSERVFVVLSRAAGWRARFVYFTQGGQPAHVTAQVFDTSPRPGGPPGTPKGWTWAETTIAAKYGEHPFAAAKRIGIKRVDLDGSPYVLVDGNPQPMASVDNGGSLLVIPAGKAILTGLGFAAAQGVRRSVRAQKRRVATMGTMAWPSYLGDDFAQQLVNYSASIGADPLDVLKLLLSESGLQPHAWNPNGFPAGQGAVGINQLAPVNWGYFQNAGLSVDQYRALTASQQLPYVFAYFKAVMSGHNLTSISGRDLYWLNFLPAYYSPGSTDLHVIVTSSSGYYTNNKSLDHGGKGFITAGDLQLSLDAKESSPLFQLIAPEVLATEGGPTVPIAGAVLAVALVIGAHLADLPAVRPLFQSLGIA